LRRTIDSDTYPHTNTDSYSNPKSYCYTDANANAYSLSNCDSNAHSNSHTPLHAYSYGDVLPYAEAYSHTKTSPNTEVSPDSAVVISPNDAATAIILAGTRIVVRVPA
jgi:hypothetical protein